jgi:ATP-binding cassette subfamily B protein
MTFLALYRRVLGLLAPEATLAVTLAVANVAIALIHFVEPIVFGKAIDVLTSHDLAGDDLWQRSATLVGTWAGIGIAGILAGIAVALHADRLAHRRRIAAISTYFGHVLDLDAAYHGESNSGRLLKIMLTGSDHLFSLWLAFFREHLATCVALFVLLPLSLALNWRLGLLLVGLIAVFAVLTTLIIAKTQIDQAEVERINTRLAEEAGDALANVMVVRSFGRIRTEVEALRRLGHALLDTQFPVLNWWALFSVLTGAAGTVTGFLILGFGTWLHVHGQASVGEIITFMGLATQLIGGLDRARGFVSRLFFQMHGLIEFFDVLDTRSAVADAPDAGILARPRGQVRFENVSFDYGGKRPAVHDLSFEVAPGQMVALVGTTGAGKSTTVGLLQRQWDPSAGAIRIDGIDIRDVTLASLREQVGVVFQESLLFRRSIADNLRVGRPGADDEALAAAAAQAQALDFIMSQPQAWETRVGDRGSNMSGGERQRLAIARALLKDPPILVLDEATSALDAATEAKVQTALKALMKGRTTFVVAHRLSTIRDADLILVFDQGRIVERGRFQELARAGGPFSRLVASQIAEPLEAEAAA